MLLAMLPAMLPEMLQAMLSNATSNALLILFGIKKDRLCNPLSLVVEGLAFRGKMSSVVSLDLKFYFVNGTLSCLVYF